jgi:hypothetical protein
MAVYHGIMAIIPWYNDRIPWYTGGILVVYWWYAGGILVVYWWYTVASPSKPQFPLVYLNISHPYTTEAFTALQKDWIGLELD